MSNLYEISTALENGIWVDEETGEINEELLNNLNMAFDDKAENIACYIKDLVADAAKIKAEETALAERRKRKENKAESLKKYITSIMQLANRPKLEYTRATIRISTNKAIEVDDSFVEWAKSNADDLLTYKEPTPNKTAIKAVLDSGKEVQGAKIVEHTNINIK